MNLIKQSLLSWEHLAIDSFKRAHWWHENLETWKFLYFGSKKPRNSVDTVIMDVTVCLKEATILPWEVMENLLTILIEPASISNNVTNVFWMNMPMDKDCPRIHQNHPTVSFLYFKGLIARLITGNFGDFFKWISLKSKSTSKILIKTNSKWHQSCLRIFGFR